MTNLINEIKTHVILTHSGSNYYITTKQNENLTNIGLDDFIVIDNNKIKGSSISEVITIDKFYEIFPDKKPIPEQPNYFSDIDFIDFRSEKLSRDGLKSMIIGIKRAIDEFRASGKEPYKALALLAKAEKALKLKQSKT